MNGTVSRIVAVTCVDAACVEVGDDVDLASIEDTAVR